MAEIFPENHIQLQPSQVQLSMLLEGGQNSLESSLSSPSKESELLPLPEIAIEDASPFSLSVRGRPLVDVIATYMNTSDTRSIKTDKLRPNGSIFASPRSQNRARTLSGMSKDGSADWGWFADIDSSSESWGADGSLQSLRRKLSVELGLVDTGNSIHVLGDEQANTRITAAHKTFTITMDGKNKVVSGTISIPKFRIVQSRSGTDRHAQYLITFKLGKDFYADWRRYSEFGELAKTLEPDRFQRSLNAWKNIETRWFNRLEPSYLHQKCIALENFVRELMYESCEPPNLVNFLGGVLGKVNSRPGDIVENRPSAQLPKEMRPPQPRHERELFERMWAENFKRSSVNYPEPPVV